MINTQVITPEDEYEIVKSSLKDPQEFEVLYNLHYHSIFRFVENRINDINIASEIVSDVFYKAITKLDTFKFKGLSIKVWIMQIAYNELMSYFRNKSKVRMVSIERENLEELAADGESETFLDIDSLTRALDSLTESELDLVEMKYFEKRSHREIAEILGLSESNAKVKLHRIVKKLRANFK